MHRAARLARHRVGHECGIDAMLLGHGAHNAFEQEHLIRKLQRVAMQKVHLKLGSAHFVYHRVDVETHQFTVIIDVINDVFIFVHRLKPIRLARRFRASA